MKKNFLLSLIYFVFLFSCGENESLDTGITWNKIGLDGRIVHKLSVHENMLYAATDDGMYRKNLSGQSSFESIGLKNANVEAFIVFSENEIMASVIDRSDVENSNIFHTNNGGESWNIMPSHFGGDSKEPAFDLVRHPDNPDILYGAGYIVVAKSEDRGQTWSPVWGFWDGFASGTSVVAINPQNTSEIWGGGQGAIENGYLIRRQHNASWDEWYDLVPNPSVAKKIVFDRQSPQSIYVGWEGALLRTQNGGQSWTTLIDRVDDSKFFFGIALSREDPNLVFAGGWLKNFELPQPFVLYVSKDKGNTWQEKKYSAESFGGIYDMEIVSTPSAEHVFAGLYKGGVYEIVFDRNGL